MESEDLVRKIMAEVMANLGQDAPKLQASAPAAAAPTGAVTVADYPLSEKSPEKIKTRTGKGFGELTLDKVLSGQLTADDMRVSPETLEFQAQVAEDSGRPHLANNLRRAAEMVVIPDDELLAAYDSLRPYRKSRQELIDMADELERKYSCHTVSALIREAADVYEARGRTKRD